MPETLYVRLNDVAPESGLPEAAWCLGGEGVHIHDGHLAQIAANGAHPVVLIPGACVSMHGASLPTQNRQRMLRAAPYALEDQLVDDVEDLHFALGDSGGDQPTPVAVIARARMDHWLARLREHGLEPQLVAPDYLAVPWQEGAWSLWVEGNTVLLRSARQRGSVLDVATLDVMLPLLLNESDTRPARLVVYGRLPDDGQGMQSLCLESGLEFQQHSGDESLLQKAASAGEGALVNLLQGDYGRREQWGRQWRPWLPVAAMLAIWLAVHLAGLVVDHFRLSGQSQALAHKIDQIYLATFPDARKVVDARVQMEQRLNELRRGGGGGGQFIQLLESLALLSDNQIPYDLQRLRYQERELNVDLTLNDLQTLDRIKQLLAQRSGVSMQVVSASARGDKVEARLLIRGAGP